MQSLSRIGSGLGVPLYADACTTTVDHISYARVLVEMDITKDFPKEIKVEDLTGRIFGQPIEEEDKMIGAQVHEAEIKDFSTFIEDIGMNILKHNDREYTWSNGHTYSRIDWALVNAKWMLYIPIVKVMVMDLGCSDHSPLSLLLAQKKDKRPNPFRFLNHLVKHEKFHKVVVTAWGRSNIKGSMAEVKNCEAGTEKALRNLHNTEFRGVEDKIKKCRQKLIDLQSTMKQPG
ncbi:hypothetical protein BC332_15465 [Capsicum chinense]|nr:hypothetical protein BC332_15465 [Capsicum chinense]